VFSQNWREGLKRKGGAKPGMSRMQMGERRRGLENPGRGGERGKASPAACSGMFPRREEDRGKKGGETSAFPGGIALEEGGIGGGEGGRGEVVVYFGPEGGERKGKGGLAAPFLSTTSPEKGEGGSPSRSLFTPSEERGREGGKRGKGGKGSLLPFL